METQFPDSKREERHLYKAFELLETERVNALLQQNGINRETRVIHHVFRAPAAKWWAAAAVLLFATLSIYIYRNTSQSSPQQLADNSLSTVVADYNFSNRGSEPSQYLFEAQNAFNNGQWEVAAKHLETAIAKTPATDTNALMTINFYKGIVDLQQNNFNQAILSFTPVVNFNNGALQKDAVWLRALAHIKNKNTTNAKHDLKLTAQHKGWKKANEAIKLLQSMEEK